MARHSDAAAPLSKFRAFVEATPRGRLEEIYTGAFDLDATCHPYVGYHLFGESYKRSVFLLELKERYRAQGYIANDKDLPDRLSILLRFLSMSDDVSLAQEIIGEALIPALDKMAKKKGGEDVDEPRGGSRPYQDVLLTLQILLQQLQFAPDREREAGYAGGKADVC
ncbi:MAG: nitrate reductase molybdenum cofactor assembly chaperone [Dehalococcoidia bacterium]